MAGLAVVAAVVSIAVAVKLAAVKLVAVPAAGGEPDSSAAGLPASEPDSCLSCLVVACPLC